MGRLRGSREFDGLRGFLYDRKMDDGKMDEHQGSDRDEITDSKWEERKKRSASGSWLCYFNCRFVPNSEHGAGCFMVCGLQAGFSVRVLCNRGLQEQHSHGTPRLSRNGPRVSLLTELCS